MVPREDVQPPVSQQKALPHVIGDGTKLLLSCPQLIHLTADGAILLTDAIREGLELRVDRTRNEMLNIQLMDGIYDPSYGAQRQRCQKQHHQYRDHQHTQGNQAKDLRREIAGDHAQKQTAANQQHRSPRKESIAEDPSCHTSPPIL